MECGGNSDRQVGGDTALDQALASLWPARGVIHPKRGRLPDTENAPAFTNGWVSGFCPRILQGRPPSIQIAIYRDTDVPSLGTEGRIGYDSLRDSLIGRQCEDQAYQVKWQKSFLFS